VWEIEEVAHVEEKDVTLQGSVHGDESGYATVNQARVRQSPLSEPPRARRAEYAGRLAPTRLDIHARRMALVGKKHAGWLPDGTAAPLPKPVSEVVVDFVIEGDDQGAMLYWTGRDGSRWNYWRESVRGAIERAEFSWGISPDEWEST